MVFKFTISQSGLLFGNMTASDSYIGVFIMQDCPDPDNPALLTGWSTSYINTLTIPSENISQPQEILLLPGDYYFIVSSYPPPETIQFTLDLWLEPLSECPPPILPVVNAVSADSAVLGWVETGEAVQWDILFGETGFDPENEGSLIQGIMQNPFTLSGLNAVTTYDFYVRSVCAEDIVSDWAGPKTFTTECDYAFSTAFAEGFESQFAPAECWQMWYENPAPAEENLMTHTSDVSYSGARSFKFSSWVSGSPYFQFLRTPELDFGAGLEVSFKYQGLSDIQQVLFSVGFSEDGQAWTWGEDITDADNTWKNFSGVFPSSARYVAIQYKGTYMRHLFVDDFVVIPTGNPEISVTPDEFSFSVSQGNLITDMLFISNNGDTDLIYTAVVEASNASGPGDGKSISGNQWLTISQDQGIIPPETSDTVVLTVDAENLPTGFFQASVVISSNDPASPVISVPVTLDVLTGIEANMKTSVLIYPVPATDHLFVKSGLAVGGVRIYDALGQSYLPLISTQATTLIIESGHFPEGVYLLKILFENRQILNRKFIIKK